MKQYFKGLLSIAFFKGQSEEANHAGDTLGLSGTLKVALGSSSLLLLSGVTVVHNCFLYPDESDRVSLMAPNRK